jgi:hypothetical protein
MITLSYPIDWILHFHHSSYLLFIILLGFLGSYIRTSTKQAVLERAIPRTIHIAIAGRTVCVPAVVCCREGEEGGRTFESRRTFESGGSLKIGC